MRFGWFISLPRWLLSSSLTRILWRLRISKFIVIKWIRLILWYIRLIWLALRRREWLLKRKLIWTFSGISIMTRRRKSFTSLWMSRSLLFLFLLLKSGRIIIRTALTCSNITVSSSTGMTLPSWWTTLTVFTSFILKTIIRRVRTSSTSVSWT